MKKCIITPLKSVLYSFFLIGNTLAQSADTDVSLAASKMTHPISHVTAFDTIVNSTITLITTDRKRSNSLTIQALKSDVWTAKVNVRILNYMQKNYKNSGNSEWKWEDRYICATMRAKDITTVVLFMTNGKWLRSTRTYREPLLSRDIKHLITRKYSNYVIKEIQEVKERDESPTAYYVRVEDALSYKDLLVYAGKVDVYNVETKE